MKETERNEKGNLVVRTPSGRVIEYESKPEGGAKPVTVIEPDGKVYFEGDMKRERLKHEKSKEFFEYIKSFEEKKGK